MGSVGGAGVGGCFLAGLVVFLGFILLEWVFFKGFCWSKCCSKFLLLLFCSVSMLYHIPSYISSIPPHSTTPHHISYTSYLLYTPYISTFLQHSLSTSTLIFIPTFQPILYPPLPPSSTAQPSAFCSGS